MPVTPTYPGLYLEELPSNARTITAAPTSITVFVGYTHPFKTKTLNTAVELFSFSEYEREFGGLFTSGTFDNTLAHAVNQFFLNGGSMTYVVGLAQQLKVGGGWTSAAPASLTLDGIVFTAREPADTIPLTVTVSNQNGNTADFTIAYGSRLETFRQVTLDNQLPGYIEKVIGTASEPVSGLVTVASAGATYGATMPTANGPQQFPAGIPVGVTDTFNPSDFTPVFAADASLDKVPIFNILCLPGVADTTVWAAALAFAERKLAFAIVDPPRNTAADTSGGLIDIATAFASVAKSHNGALYFPYLQGTDPLTGTTMELAPSGVVAGKFADNDLNRGIWKAPAGFETQFRTVTGVVPRGWMTDVRQGVLNDLGVNCIRTFRDAGTVIFGARTMLAKNLAFQQWRYVPVRRMALFIEQTLMNNLGWAVFEPNDEPLWTALRTTVSDFMLGLFNQHAFQGSTPSQAFRVVCDATTTTQADIDKGIVNIIVAFRPLKPAEFVIIKIAQLAGQAQS